MSVDASASSPPPAAADRSTGRDPAAGPRPSFLDRLAARTERVGTSLCVGLDPDPASLPPGFSPDVAGVEVFSRQVIDAASGYAAAVKANIAFFEAFGSAGIAALERLRARLPADLPFIVDAKRGDVASTAARQAVALFDALGADAITVNPYLGREALAPLIERDDRFAYLLCRTSNPGAHEFQSLTVEGEPLYVAVARRVGEWSANGAQVGLVVGATAPAELAIVRQAAPGLAFLVPGVGAQGGDVEPVLAHGPAIEAPGGRRRGGGLLVNVSRGISAAVGSSRDAGDELRAAIQRWAQILRC